MSVSNDWPTNQDAALGEVADGGTKGILDAESPLLESAETAAVGRGHDNVHHELPEQGEAVDRLLAGDRVEGL